MSEQFAVPLITPPYIEQVLNACEVLDFNVLQSCVLNLLGRPFNKLPIHVNDNIHRITAN